MIPNCNPHIYARLTGQLVPVVAWSDEGEAMIPNSDAGTLHPVGDVVDFQALVVVGDPHAKGDRTVRLP